MGWRAGSRRHSPPCAPPLGQLGPKTTQRRAALGTAWIVFETCSRPRVSAAADAPDHHGIVRFQIALLMTLIVGGVIGWLASRIMKTGAQMGLIANIVVGIVGAVLGFWLAGALGIVAMGSVGAWIMSVLGAVVLIAILKAMNIYK